MIDELVRVPRTRSGHDDQRLDDEQLRRQLADLHRLVTAVEARGVRPDGPLIRHLADLDREYLRRFPQAAARWPWPLPPEDEHPVPAAR